MRRYLAALLLALLGPGLALAQAFPSKTVRLVSGVTPGSVTDTMARILAERGRLDLRRGGNRRRWSGSGRLRQDRSRSGPER
jgi:tripartite-type tricarboxylate transporter receptor subunit TctC